MNKITATQRKVKDLSFLLALPKQEICQGLIKRLQAQGTGLPICEIKNQFSIYLSLYRYDYQGRFNSQNLNTCIRHFSKRDNHQIPQGLYRGIQTMKLQQKSWFNISSQQLHQIPNLPHGGCHFYVIIDDIKYRNQDTFVSKQLVSKQCRQQGKKLFQSGEYQRAMRIYKKQVNITEGLDKKKYKPEELQIIRNMNLKAKINMLRCFGKLTYVDDQICQIAQSYSKQLLKVYSNDQKYKDLVQFLRIYVLIQTKYLTLAYQTAQQFLKKASHQSHDQIIKLMADIKKKMSQKSKK